MRIFVRFITVVMLSSFVFLCITIASEDSCSNKCSEGDSIQSPSQNDKMNNILTTILADLIVISRLDNSVQDSESDNDITNNDYLFYWKESLQHVNLDKIEQVFLNNHYKVSRQGTISLELMNQLYEPSPLRISSIKKSAMESVSALESKAIEEARNISKKYFIDDMNKWRKKGQFVPQKELSSRIVDAPFFRALCVLKKLFSCSVCELVHDCASSPAVRDAKNADPDVETGTERDEGPAENPNGKGEAEQ